ncbi:hypothetical protein Scep_007434 [Stephania cephalantha]|uniref:Uncharacterized protein n=1 Tax=Stephania cephalantha TaxID=152367 RepID=A0AAP0KA17_9MAGN
MEERSPNKHHSKSMTIHSYANNDGLNPSIYVHGDLWKSKSVYQKSVMGVSREPKFEFK